MIEQQTYKPRFWVVINSNFSALIFLGVGIFFMWHYSSLVPRAAVIFAGSVTFIPFVLFIFPIYRYFIVSKEVLLLSDNDDIFYFGDQGNEVKYNKKDIERILIYQPGGGGYGKTRHHFFYVYELHLRDGRKIKFSNMFISEQDVINSFDVDLIRYSTNNTFFRI